MSQSGQIPGERHSATLTLVGGSQYFLMGGTNKSTTFPTVSMFDNGEWFELPQPDVFPPVRWGHTCIAFNELIILFGGYIVGGMTNETWIYNTSNNQWNLQPVTGAVPIPRAYHSATLVGSDMFILGGEGVTSMSDDVHVLNIDNWEWRRPETHGSIPQPKKRHSSVLVNNSLYVWGGWCFAVTEHIQDLDILSLETFEWRHAEQFGPVPSPRAGHISRLRGNLFFVWGGYGPSQSEWLDIHYFDVTDDSITWRTKKPMGRSKNIEQRSDVAHAITSDGKFVLFGGLVDTKTKKSCNEMIQVDISKIY